MAMRLTEILASDGSTIYVQYEEEDSDALHAVSVLEDIAERTKRFKGMMMSTIRGYAEVVLNSVQQSMTADIEQPYPGEI
jgi:hypothetical protein